jgi:hypothetical protein
MPRSTKRRRREQRACCCRTKKSGRPLAVQTVAIREAILELPCEQEMMTVRGCFYALTVRGVVEKSEAGYRQVQRQALLLRRTGVLDWGFIADGTRWVRQPELWDSTEDALWAVARTYRRNLWRSQLCRIEVWLEKDALASLVVDVTDRWGVRLMVSRGQSSDTYCHAAAEEAERAWHDAGLATFVYMLFDADKAGRVAAAKVDEKLHAYSNDAAITCELLAVNDEQIQAWNLPTRPEKQGHGEAVELDAIPPARLNALVEDAVLRNVDELAWEKEQATEASERDLLRRLAEETR